MKRASALFLQQSSLLLFAIWAFSSQMKMPQMKMQLKKKKSNF